MIISINPTRTCISHCDQHCRISCMLPCIIHENRCKSDSQQYQSHDLIWIGISRIYVAEHMMPRHQASRPGMTFVARHRTFRTRTLYSQTLKFPPVFPLTEHETFSPRSYRSMLLQRLHRCQTTTSRSLEINALQSRSYHNIASPLAPPRSTPLNTRSDGLV